MVHHYKEVAGFFKSKTPVRLWKPLGEEVEAREGENSIRTPRRRKKAT